MRTTYIERKMLIADDAPDIREALGRSLALVPGVTIESAADGFDLLGKFLEAWRRDERFEAMLIDAAMPGLDGFAAAYFVRVMEAELGVEPRTRIGFFSGHPEYVACSTWLERIEPDFYMEKPGDPEQLKGWVLAGFPKVWDFQKGVIA